MENTALAIVDQTMMYCSDVLGQEGEALALVQGEVKEMVRENLKGVEIKPARVAAVKREIEEKKRELVKNGSLAFRLVDRFHKLIGWTALVLAVIFCIALMVMGVTVLMTGNQESMFAQWSGSIGVGSLLLLVLIGFICLWRESKFWEIELTVSSVEPKDCQSHRQPEILGGKCLKCWEKEYSTLEELKEASQEGYRLAEEIGLEGQKVAYLKHFANEYIRLFGGIFRKAMKNIIERKMSLKVEGVPDRPTDGNSWSRWKSTKIRDYPNVVPLEALRALKGKLPSIEALPIVSGVYVYEAVNDPKLVIECKVGPIEERFSICSWD